MGTIAAISTPIGVGGISVVRVSGEESFEISQKVFKSYDGTLLKDMKGFTCKLGKIFYNQKCIDEVICTVFKSPKSFTGENMVQISCHGGLFITRCVLRSLLESGARMAGPGEFTKRAFLNGKISLEKAESIMGLISSNYEKEREINFSSYCGLDYPDEDVPEISDEQILDILKLVSSELKSLSDSYTVSSIIKNGSRTAIVGAPNTGKSTLMNLLSNREKSIVTDIPGTTRDAIEENIILGDSHLVLIDTAGIRETCDKIEKIGVEKSKEIAKNSDLIFMMVDASRDIYNEELEILNSIDKNKTIIIVNKIDINRNYKLDIFKNMNVVCMSAKTGEGIDCLTKKVSDFLNISSIQSGSLLLSTERQYDIINKAYIKISEVINSISSVPRDIFVDMIKEILKILSEFTGENVEKEIDGRIF